MDDEVALAAVGRENRRRRRRQGRQRGFAPRRQGRRDECAERQGGEDVGEEIVCGRRWPGQPVVELNKKKSTDR